MGQCKGNLGNLMQHWVLCETIACLEQTSYTHIQLTCTHSMAPWSMPESVDYSNNHSPRLHRRRYFDAVRKGMYGRATSAYERCWRHCSLPLGIPYPSSAVLAWNLWSKNLSLYLWEANENTANEIEGWSNLPEVSSRLTQFSLNRGDWRGMLNNNAFLNPNAEVHLVELDPMQFECINPVNDQARNGALLYPDDIIRLVNCFQEVEKPIIIQVSSYDVNNNNPLNQISPAICNPFIDAGFNISARVMPNNQMISLVISRGLLMWQGGEDLNERFNQWLGSH